MQKPVHHRDKLPSSFSLEDGTPIYGRFNWESPYLMDYRDGRFCLLEQGEIIADNLRFPPKPNWYSMRCDDGTPMPAIVNALWGQQMFVTLNKYLTPELLTRRAVG